MSARPKAVLFDCDGVLADTEAMHDRILAEGVTALGWPMTAHEVRRTFLGLGWASIGPMVAARIGRPLPPDWGQRLIARVVEELEREVPAIPGAPEAVMALHAAGIPVACASNSSRRELAMKIERLGLAGIFDGRVFAVEDVVAPKPAPDLYLAAAAACGADPRHCVVVEDSVVGTRAGRAAGCRVLGYASATTAEALLEAGAEPFASMEELPRLLGLAPEMGAAQ